MTTYELIKELRKVEDLNASVYVLEPRKDDKLYIVGIVIDNNGQVRLEYLGRIS